MKLKVHIEKIKTGAIVLLSASALFLMAQSGLLEQFAVHGPGESAQTHQPAQSETRTEILTQPLFIAVSNGEAGRCGIKYEGEKLSGAYGELSMALGEALGSSGEPEPITRAQWERCLSGSSVFFDYYYVRDLSLIAEGLGVQTGWKSDGAKASVLCLSEENGGLTLCYRDASSAQAYRCATALDWSRIAYIFAQYPPNGAVFAFELPEDYAHLSPYTLILNAMPDIRPVTAKNTLYADGGVDRLLRLLNINAFVASRYTEADGTEVYVEGGDKTLRLDGDGQATFRQSPGSGLQLVLGTLTEPALARAAWELVSAGLGAPGGEARLELSNLDYDPAEDAYTIGFDYVLNGIPIRSASGRGAAELTVERGFLTALHLWFRGFEQHLDGSLTVLPERQAAALAERVEGTRLLLIYEERADAVTAKWVTAR